jgi:epoxyqueuosine reductase
MEPLLERIRQLAEPFGLNLIGATRVADYDTNSSSAIRAHDIAPGARSIVLIGNGGGEFWRAFKSFATDHTGWSERANPLDDFTRLVIENQIMEPLAISGERCVAVYPFLADGPTLNFMDLGKRAGIAGPSILGVLVNPTYGPWIAFRAALLLDREIDQPGEAVGFDPCPSCTVRTCVTACPAAAITARSGWDIPRCLSHRVEQESDCAPRCHARVACVIGPEHRYPDDEIAYHQMRALRAMRPYYTQHLGRPR